MGTCARFRDPPGRVSRKSRYDRQWRRKTAGKGQAQEIETLKKQGLRSTLEGPETPI